MNTASFNSISSVGICYFRCLNETVLLNQSELIIHKFSTYLGDHTVKYYLVNNKQHRIKNPAYISEIHKGGKLMLHYMVHTNYILRTRKITEYSIP